jgi:hypothetical protein
LRIRGASLTLHYPVFIAGIALSAPNMLCPICNKRKAERFCPAKGEKICAVCCGREREVIIDCPVDCGYLIAAHRYELKQNKPLPVSEVPFPDVDVPRDLIHLNRSLISGLAFAILKCSSETPSVNDTDVLTALHALAEKFRTLGSGIYYEKPPAGGPPQAIYAALDKFIEDFKQQLAKQGGPARLKDTDSFLFLVFLQRVGRQHTSGRPKSRAYLEFLRGQFPKAVAAPEPDAPRIIIP